MRSNKSKTSTTLAAIAVAILLLAGGVASGQSISLTAAEQIAVLPDGQSVHMWGWTCGASSGVACTALNGATQAGGAAWQPPLITVPSGSNLTISLTNSLRVPTSITIVGQLGGGQGVPTFKPSPSHISQPTTWPVAGDTSASTFTPPSQADRVESFGTEVAAGAPPVALTWNNLKSGTYLIESGTHPSIQGPMGLYGVLVVTTSPAGAAPGVAYPNVSYDADAIALLSEIDPAQNLAVDTAVKTAGFSEVATHTLKLGDTVTGISIVNAGSGYTAAPAVTIVGGGAITNATAAATVDLTPGSPTYGTITGIAVIDGGKGYTSAPNVTIAASPSGPTATATATAGLSSAPSAACGGAPACYPPAVNYTPLYYLINGQSFDKTAPSKSVLSVPAPATTSNGVLLRLVNAGLRMHVPSVVGLDMSLIAEDGNVLPGNPKIQNEVFLAPGKVYDVRLNPASSGNPATYDAANYPVFDRQLSLSANNQTDGGMHAILQIAGGKSLSSITQIASVTADQYFLSPDVTITVSEPAKGVVANDVGVYGVQLVTGPSGGTVTLNPDGTFIYVPSPGTTSDSFTYEANGNPALITSVTLAACTGSCHGGAPTAADDSYTSTVSTVLKINRPGVLLNDSDPSGFPLAAVFGSATGCSVSLNADGSFSATTTTPGVQCSFTYQAQNSQKTLSASATAMVMFPTANGPTVTVQDATNPAILISDYKWVLEEDDTLHAPVGVSTPSTSGVPTLTTSFHTSHMALIATGCTGPVSCGTGQYVYDNNPASATYGQHVPVDPETVTTLDRVVLDPSKYYYLSVLPGDAADPAHTVGGSPIAPGQSSVTVLLEPSPLPPAQLSVFVFEDNNPTNGDVDTVEESQGLGGFQIILNDVAGATGDPTGQMTYDMFNMPLTNALANARDTSSGHNMCPITTGPNNLMGMIITCPALEDDGRTPSPVAGQALIKNLFPNRFDVLVSPGAVREAAGEHWIQTSTLEGTRANDAFAKAGEPAYFQEFGPPGFHAFVGFVSPDHIAARNKALAGNNTLTGQITMLHMSRPSNVTLYDSASNESLAQSTCYVGLNSSGGSGEDIAFAACDQMGHYKLTGVPVGSYELVVWDQWLDQIIDYEAVTVPVGSSNATINIGDKPVFSWFTRVETSIYFDANKNGVRDSSEAGLSQLTMRTRYRDGAISNFIPTDTDGNSPFDELFPLFNWYVIESDTTRYKGTGVHVAVDGGGAVASDPLFPGILTSTYPTGESTVRTDPGTTLSEGIQSFISQTIQMDWGKTPYVAGENGGILGHVIYASTRPFDDPTLGFQNTWEPLVPRVQVDLYQETTGPDNTIALLPVDKTTTSSWDDYVNGSHVDPVTHATVPNMQCPGQLTTDPFYNYTLQGLPGGQYRCYDGFHNWNQAQPAPFDGQYQFPSADFIAAHPLTASQLSNGQTLVSLPPGKYVVEVVVPPGYQIVKEEDKNILIGDTYIAPEVQQFGALSNIFILPDQAEIGAYNSTNPNNSTYSEGRTNFANFGPGGVGINNTPCVGQLRVVPDFLSLFPAVQQVAPFAGAVRPLCDRREATLEDQTQAGADFLIFTPTPIASHFTGIILDDASAEFNTAAPDYGEKFGVPFVPVSFRDFNGVETFRTYSDQFGAFNGLVYSTWAVNPPNPTGYAPNMMITCMNDPGPIPDPSHSGQLITDPLYNPNYSNFCYTVSFMPGVTDYMDTPVLPLAAFASGYNYVDCAYPDATPAILSVTGDPIGSGGGSGPWVGGTGPTHVLTINALGDQKVPNNAYMGPSGSPTSLAGQKTVTRHYGFGTQGPGSQVTLGNATLLIASWNDSTITATLPAGTTSGQLVITAANGKQSIDAVTVTVEAKIPTYVAAPPQSVVTGVGSGLLHPIQDAIDGATAGDLIIVGPGTYPELVIMSKPVRLQGVGASAVIINAAKFPTQKVADWRTRINALFAYDSQGNPIAGATPLVDPLPGQEITGGVVLLEPSVLSTEEGAGITVLAKNLGTSGNSRCSTTIDGKTVYNFHCADGNTARAGHVAKPRIDGISITGGDAGGAIYVNGWAHNLEISNNRIYGNAGTFSGGVRIGQPYLEGQALPANVSNQFGFNYDINVNLHNNKITNNGTIESNIGENGGGGGVSICSGSDNYKLQYNFICGNYSQGDGGGVGHVGLSNSGNISNNTIIFNQSFFQGYNTSGGGIVIEGEPSTLGGLTAGTGNVSIDSNEILGNHAGGGHGGGIRLQSVNGADVSRRSPSGLWKVTITNNMITNNVAGYSGGGISLLDASNSSIVNNTIVSNDSTATVGALFTTSHSMSSFQPAGISSELHSPALATATGQAFSNPTLVGDIIYGNRSFYFSAGVTDPLTGATPSVLVPTLTSGVGYACPSGANYWDLGVVGQAQASQTLFLTPASSILTALTAADGYTSVGTTNVEAADPLVIKEYCNGPRANPGIPDTTPTAPPQQFAMQAAATEDEGGNFIDVHYGPLSLSDSSITTGGAGYGAPLGDYHLQAASTAAINGEPCNAGNRLGNSHDFDGQVRPQPSCPSGPSGARNYDIGADEYQVPAVAVVNLAPGVLTFASQVVGTASSSHSVTLSNTGGAPFLGLALSFTGPYARAASGGTCGGSLAAGATCTINVVFSPTAPGTASGSLAIAGSVVVTGSPVSLTGTGVAAILSAALTPTSHNFGSANRGVNAFLAPTQIFTLTNTGNTTLSGIVSPALTQTGPANFVFVNIGTTCGTLNPLPALRVTSLAPNASCIITVQFRPPSGETTGPKSGTLSIGDAAGTQSSGLSGTAR